LLTPNYYHLPSTLFILHPSSFILYFSLVFSGISGYYAAKECVVLRKNHYTAPGSISGGSGMVRIRKNRRITGLALGLAVAIGLMFGLMVGGVWPQTSLHAMATDRVDTYAMATGLVDEDVEAVYFLDFLTGELNAFVMGKQAGGFCGFFTFNVANHLGIDPGKNPRYLMVTGVASLRRGGSRMQLSRAVVYVAEVTSGKVGAYAVPWNPSMAAAGQKMEAPLIPVAKAQFRNAPFGGIPTTSSNP
jgi:hypothetical protein